MKQRRTGKWRTGTRPQRGWSILLLCSLCASVLPATAQQSSTAVPVSLASNSPAPNAIDADTAGLPDSPGAVSSLNAQSQSGSASSEAPQSQDSPPQPSNVQSAQPAPQKPVGTAAAEAPNASGVAASQPAGVAIAPAKQHRARTIIIRVGAIIGVAVAVGTVVALTEATSSKPPGAH